MSASSDDGRKVAPDAHIEVNGVVRGMNDGEVRTEPAVQTTQETECRGMKN